MSGPTYPGSFVGQTVNLGGVYVPKRVAWKQKNDDGLLEWRFGRTQKFQPYVFIWNGKAWLTEKEFSVWRKERMLLIKQSL